VPAPAPLPVLLLCTVVWCTSCHCWLLLSRLTTWRWQTHSRPWTTRRAMDRLVKGILSRTCWNARARARAHELQSTHSLCHDPVLTQSLIVSLSRAVLTRPTTHVSHHDHLMLTRAYCVPLLISVGCNDGNTIAAVVFADYGQATGDCTGGFAVDSACSSASFSGDVSAGCMGQTTCVVECSAGSCTINGAVHDDVGDPCPNKPKHVCLSVTCSTPPPPPPPPPDPPPPPPPGPPPGPPPPGPPPPGPPPPPAPQPQPQTGGHSTKSKVSTGTAALLV
jgi:hypothetical protein